MARRINATDLAALSRCDREVYLDYHGDASLRAPRSAYQTWLTSQGTTYENQVLASFEFNQPPYTVENLDLGVEITFEFMKKGVRLIAQGVLLHEDLVGIPDLLERVEGNSELGSYYYRPIDIKSASSANNAHKIQVMAYCYLLEHIQGIRPNGALLMNIPPDERTDQTQYHEVPVEFDSDEFDIALQAVRKLVGGQEAPPFYSAICGECAWRDVCIPIVEVSNDVSLVPGIKRTVWRELRGRGVTTLDKLASLSPGDILDIKGIGEKTAPDIIRKAQALSRKELIRLGQAVLPAGPLIVFDIESVPNQNVYYLFGTMQFDLGAWHFEPFLAEQLEDEGDNWRRFLDRIGALPGSIVHYGNYERTAVQKLGERHGTPDQSEALLARMVDLERAVKETAVLPLWSYSLKTIAPWIGFQWSSMVAEGSDSVLEYIQWLEDRDRVHLDRILHYNHEDCRATLAVFDWLRGLPDD